MLTNRPCRPATNLLFLLCLCLNAQRVSAQESGTALELVDGTTDPALLFSDQKAAQEAVISHTDRHICTLTLTKPKHPKPPFVDRHPMRITSLGVEVGVDGPTPHVGHTSKIVLKPIYNYRTAPTFTLTIRGPHGYVFESHIVMPVQQLDVCEPIPHYPDSCKGPHALTRYHLTELNTPAWPHSGMYSIHIGPSKSDPLARRYRGQARHFEVLDHPLAQHIALPEGYKESSRTAEDIRVATKDSTVYSGTSLVLCGQKRRTQLCIRTTTPIPSCQEQLESGAAPVLHANMASVRAHPEVENDQEATSWCSNDRMVTVYSSRRWGKARMIEQLQELILPDDLAQESLNDGL